MFSHDYGKIGICKIKHINVHIYIYIYNTLHPIISQILSPIYGVAKQLNKPIAQYLPAKYQINSTDEFLQFIRATAPEGLLASLDVEKLFMNVPVPQTIYITKYSEKYSRENAFIFCTLCV